MQAPAHKAARVRLLVLDVDGVLTDGRLHFSSDGSEIKSFHARDGAGIKALQKSGITVAVISGRTSVAVEKRMAELGVENVIQGCDDKATALKKLIKKLSVARDDVACVGDDTADLPMFDHSGFTIGVANADADIVARADWITTTAGGHGAVREVCDLILAAQSGKDDLR